MQTTCATPQRAQADAELELEVSQLNSCSRSWILVHKGWLRSCSDSSVNSNNNLNFNMHVYSQSQRQAPRTPLDRPPRTLVPSIRVDRPPRQVVVPSTRVDRPVGVVVPSSRVQESPRLSCRRRQLS